MATLSASSHCQPPMEFLIHDAWHLSAPMKLFILGIHLRYLSDIIIRRLAWKHLQVFCWSSCEQRLWLKDFQIFKWSNFSANLESPFPPPFSPFVTIPQNPSKSFWFWECLNPSTKNLLELDFAVSNSRRPARARNPENLHPHVFYIGCRENGNYQARIPAKHLCLPDRDTPGNFPRRQNILRLALPSCWRAQWVYHPQ